MSFSHSCLPVFSLSPITFPYGLQPHVTKGDRVCMNNLFAPCKSSVDFAVMAGIDDGNQQQIRVDYRWPCCSLIYLDSVGIRMFFNC